MLIFRLTKQQTRKHSSRMRATCLLTMGRDVRVGLCVCVQGGCQYAGGIQGYVWTHTPLDPEAYTPRGTPWTQRQTPPTPREQID